MRKGHAVAIFRAGAVGDLNTHDSFRSQISGSGVLLFGFRSGRDGLIYQI